ncbi:MAG: hypothetical protein Rubg2KO_21850 [Rubricoccaceae bacterium]
MSADRAFALFEEALDLPNAERPAFLDTASNGDLALRARVETLLRADATAHPLFDASPADLATLLPDDPPSSFEGREIGPYRIVREIGRGGMGAVYLAERADVGKRVALKLVAGSLADPDRLARFLVERRVLARLEHPGIAGFLDAGVMADGTPWFAMEYVEGEPLDRHCDARRLSVPDRLALFERVCEAVAYAHRNLVVHRDLKPSNVLVTDEGEVKLLDFGIARLLEDDDDGLTRTGITPMTPDFAAPEQLLREPVTTATDVYQLGVVLYELLSGHRPYRLGGLSLGEIERQVVHETPLRPSVAVGQTEILSQSHGSTESVSPTHVASQRGTEPHRLSRRLAGELDAIVTKAMAKEPERRYASAEGLLDDLARYRKKQPVTARADTWDYRTRKFVARHRVGLSGAAAFLGLVITFLVFYTVRITHERDRAQQESEKATQVSAFLMDILRDADPTDAAGREITATEMLDRSYARVQEELADQPTVQAEMLGLMSEVYTELGRFDVAAEAAGNALRVASQAYGPMHPVVVDATQRLISALDYLGRTEEAVPYVEALIPAARAPGHENALAHLLASRGRLAWRLGDFARARDAYQEALAVQRPADPEAAARRLTIKNNYGVLLYDAGDYAEAERVHREVYGIRLQRSGPLNTQTLSSMRNLARARHGLGHWEDAEALQREAVRLGRQAYPSGHPRVGTLLFYLGRQLLDAGQFPAADSALAEAYEIQRAAQGRDRIETARYATAWARTRGALGDRAAADSLLPAALQAAVEAVGEEHYAVAEVHYALGEHAARSGDTASAEASLRRAATLQRAALGRDHPDTEATLRALRALR